jgi:hypothetical protein
MGQGKGAISPLEGMDIIRFTERLNIRPPHKANTVGAQVKLPLYGAPQH